MLRRRTLCTYPTPTHICVYAGLYKAFAVYLVPITARCRKRWIGRRRWAIPYVSSDVTRRSWILKWAFAILGSPKQCVGGHEWRRDFAALVVKHLRICRFLPFQHDEVTMKNNQGMTVWCWSVALVVGIWSIKAAQAGFIGKFECRLIHPSVKEDAAF